MPSAYALGIVSRNSILDFGVAERLRAFRYSFFTGGVVMENGRCSAASYGSATLRTFPTIAARNKKAIVFASLHQRWLRIGAADEARTRYLHLGKVALYQMSYGRIFGAFVPAPSRAILANFGAPAKACECKILWGRGEISVLVTAVLLRKTARQAADISTWCLRSESNQ